MTKTFTCILCPNGCALTATQKEDGTLFVEGNRCRRGEQYAIDEATDPMRTISTSIAVQGGDQPLVSVRLTKPVPKGKIFPVVKVIKQQKLTAPVRLGQLVLENILGLGADVIATTSVEKR